jgi:hydroxymethylbilane synthase
LERRELDGAILACAGLERLGRGDVIAQVLAPEVILPAPGQGALGIQCRADDAELCALLGMLDDADTRAEVTAERALLGALGGGCQVPIGALARVDGGALTLWACVATLDGARILRSQVSGAAASAVSLGHETARRLSDQGADAIVAACR